MSEEEALRVGQANNYDAKAPVAMSFENEDFEAPRDIDREAPGIHSKYGEAGDDEEVPIVTPWGVIPPAHHPAYLRQGPYADYTAYPYGAPQANPDETAKGAYRGPYGGVPSYGAPRMPPGAQTSGYWALEPDDKGEADWKVHKPDDPPPVYYGMPMPYGPYGGMPGPYGRPGFPGYGPPPELMYGPAQQRAPSPGRRGKAPKPKTGAASPKTKKKGASSASRLEPPFDAPPMMGWYGEPLAPGLYGGYGGGYAPYAKYY